MANDIVCAKQQARSYVYTTLNNFLLLQNMYLHCNESQNA